LNKEKTMNNNNETSLAQSMQTKPSGGVIFSNFEQMATFARTASGAMQVELAKSGLNTPGKVLLALQQGQELNIPPMATLRSIAIIGGKPTIYGDIALALVERSGLLEEFEETEPDIEEIGHDLTKTKDNIAAVCRVKRKGKLQIERKFSVGDARQANLWNRHSRSGEPMPWVTHPGRMLKYKVRAFALRDTFPDVLMGIHLYEEMQGVEMIESVEAEQPRSATILEEPQDAPESPQPEEQDLSVEEAEKQAEEKLSDYAFECRDCGSLFDETGGQGEIPLCPNCLSSKVNDLTKDKAVQKNPNK